MAIDSQIFTPDNIDSWNYQEFEDWLQSQDEDLQSAFADVAQTPIVFEAFDPINEFPPTYQDLLAVLDYAGIPQELLVSDATLATQTTNTARRFGSASNYTSSPISTKQSSELFFSDEELLSYDPFTETLTDAELLPILSDEETFARWAELHGLSDTFITADGTLFVPLDAEEFNAWFATSAEYDESQIGIENAIIEEQVTDRYNKTTRGQIVGFSNAIAPFYEKTLAYYDQHILNDVAPQLRLGSEKIPSVLWDMTTTYLKIRMSSEDYGSDLALGKFLRETLGFTEEDTTLGSGSPFMDLVIALNQINSKLPRWNGETDFDTFLAVQLRTRPDVLDDIVNLQSSEFIQRAFDQHDNLTQALSEVQSMTDAEALISFLAPFQGHQASMQAFYEQLGINTEWYDSALSQYGAQEKIPGSEYEHYNSRTGDSVTMYRYRDKVPIKPSDCPDHIWELCLEMVHVQKDQEFWNTIKQIGSVGIPIGIAVLSMVATGGASTPFAMAAIGAIGTTSAMATAGYFAYDDISTQISRHQDIQAGSAVGRQTSFAIGSDEYEALADDAREAAWVRGCVDVALAGVGTVAGIGIAGKTAQVIRLHSLSKPAGVALEAGIEGLYGATEAFISAASDHRNSTTYLVAADIQAGGNGANVSGVQAIVFETTIGALFGTGFSIGGNIVSGPLASAGRDLQGAIAKFRAQGKVRETGGRIEIQIQDGTWIDLDYAKLTVVFTDGESSPRILLDGEDITAKHQVADARRPATTTPVPQIDPDTNIPTAVLEWGYRRQAQTGNELSIFYNPDTDTFTIKDGDSTTTESVLNGTYARDLAAGEAFVAHFHPNDPYPSREDLELLHARAQLEPDKTHRHVVFGFDDEGNPSQVTLVLTVDDNSRVGTIVDGSDSLNASTLSFYQRMAQQIDSDVAAGKLDISETAVYERAEQQAAEGTQVEGTSKNSKTKVKPRSRITDDGLHIIPFGFRSSEDFMQFSSALRNGLPQGVEPIFQGSAVTGVKAVTSKGVKAGTPFDQGRKSDFDIGLISDDFIIQAMETPLGMSFLKTDPTRLGPIQADSDLAKLLNLNDLLLQLEAMSGREVSFCLYETHNDAYAYQQTLPVPE